MQSIRPARPPMLESQEIPGVTPIQQKEALEADSIPHGPAFRGKSVSQSDLANNSATYFAEWCAVEISKSSRHARYRGVETNSAIQIGTPVEVKHAAKAVPSAGIKAESRGVRLIIGRIGSLKRRERHRSVG
jgi:hypothetical protein